MQWQSWESGPYFLSYLLECVDTKFFILCRVCLFFHLYKLFDWLEYLRGIWSRRWQHAAFVFTWRRTLQWRADDSVADDGCSQRKSGTFHRWQAVHVVDIIGINKRCRPSAVTDKADSRRQAIQIPSPHLEVPTDGLRIRILADAVPARCSAESVSIRP